MLGLIHRTTLHKGPPHFQQWFYPALRQERATAVTRLSARRHNKQLFDPLDGSKRKTFFGRSAFGLVRVYNLLPQRVVEARTVRDFQRLLQNQVKDLLAASDENWRYCYCTHGDGALHA